MSYLDIALKTRVQMRVENNPYGLIDQTLKEIDEAWEPGTIEWMKANRPNEWGNMLTLERRINETALGGDLKRLREVLSEYQGIILIMVKEYKALREEKGQEMFNFVERPKSPGTG